MARWTFWKRSDKRVRKARPQFRATLRLEALEDRTLPSVTAVPGYSLTTFATSPTGASKPDSITVEGANVFVGYGNGVPPDGSGGGSSTIVEYSSTGAVVQTWSVLGHNDGLKVDPQTGNVWALQNEDASPNLAILNPLTGAQHVYTFGPVANGGGYDDIAFLNGEVFLTESNPQGNPNTAPAVVEATLVGSRVEVLPVLFGNSTAFDLVTHKSVKLNLQDPDSMTVDAAGDLVLTSQSDNEIVIIHNPDQANQSASLLPLTTPGGTTASVDDTLFPPNAAGDVLLTDQATGTIYRLTGKAIDSNIVLSAELDLGQLASLNTGTGVLTPIVSGLTNPRGLAFLPITAAPGYHVTTFATSPTGASQPDSIVVDGSSVFVGYGNGAAKDGSSGSSTIVQYDSNGHIINTWSVAGHNDGLKVDPRTHLVWALQNEDGNPNLVIIDPRTGTQTLYTFGPVANGGGYDDIAFVDGKAFLTESNPQGNPNTAPAVVEATLVGTTVQVTPILNGNATATNLVTGQPVMLNLQDPDSMTVDRAGNLVLTSQADNEIITIHHPGQSNQYVTVLPLQLSVDDTLFLPDRHGHGNGGGHGGAVLITDQATGTIYRVTGPLLGSDVPLTAALDVGQVGRLNQVTGHFVPILSGLTNPRGLAFLPG
jgi:hypothetical protein